MPSVDQQQAGPVVGELVAEGELHQLRPGDQDDERATAVKAAIAEQHHRTVRWNSRSLSARRWCGGG